MIDYWLCLSMRDNGGYYLYLRPGTGWAIICFEEKMHVMKRQKPIKRGKSSFVLGICSKQLGAILNFQYNRTQRDFA